MTKNIGVGNGTSLSALDVLVSLGQIEPDLVLINLYKNNLPQKLDGIKVNYTQSYLSPRSIELTNKANLKWIGNRIVKPYLLNKLKAISPEMTFINSIETD